MDTPRSRKSAATPATDHTPPAAAPAPRRSRAKAADPATRPVVRDSATVTKPSRRKADAGTRIAVGRESVSRKVAASGVAPHVATTSRRVRAKAPVAEPAIDLRVRDAVVARLDAMKANDLKVIDVRGKTSVTDCLVIASGTSTRHVKSMGDEVVVTAKKLGMAPIGVEGEKDAEWILVDLGDTVVHVMLPRTREFYGLERLWMLAEEARAGAHS